MSNDAVSFVSFSTFCPYDDGPLNGFGAYDGERTVGLTISKTVGLTINQAISVVVAFPSRL